MGASVFVAKRGGMIITCAATSGFMIEYDNRYLWMNLKTLKGCHFANYREAWEANRPSARARSTRRCRKVFALDDTGEAAYQVHHNLHEGKLGVLCLAPEEGLGVTDGEMRERLLPADHAVPPPRVGQSPLRRQFDGAARYRSGMPQRFTTSSAAVLMALVLVLAACGSDGSKPGATDVNAYGPPEPTLASTTSTTASTVPAAQPAQKDCVDLADPLPDGAPDVPVKVGPAPTTLIIEDLTPGTGAEAVAASSVTVDYIGVACSTGVIFDDSYSRGEAATFGLEQVIAGWTQGLLGMKVGGRRLLGIPSELAYKEAGGGEKIGPNEALWFVVDLKSVA